MYGAGIQKICEQGTFIGKGCFFNEKSDPWVWRKIEKRKKTMTVRWPETSRLVIISRCTPGQNGGTIVGGKKVPVLFRFGPTVTPSNAEAAKSWSRKVTGTEANELCPVPWTDTEGLVAQLPLKVSAGLVLESLGTLYEGPSEDKYWSQNRCGLRHPYPVGYTATKTYKGVQFKQTIEKGPDGPIFVVGEVNKAHCSANSPAKAWSLALSSSELNSAIRVHGRKHFGFDCPIVLGCLSLLGKEEVVKTGLVKDEEPGISGTDDVDQKYDLDGNRGPAGHGHKASKISDNGPQSDMGERISSAEQLRPLMTRDRAPSATPYERSIRLRSVRMEGNLHQSVEILSCQDTSHPVIRGFFQEAMSSISNEDSTIAGTFSNNEFSTGCLTVSKRNTSSPGGTVLKQGVSAMDTSLDSILKKMDEIGRSDGQGRSTSNNDTSWKREDPEKMMNQRTAERQVSNQNSARSRFFSSPVQRSRILSEESGPKDTRRPAQTRSLANLLEEWNKGGRQQSLLNGKPQLKGERINSQLLRRPTQVERMPLTWEEKHEPLTDTSVQTSLLDSKDADIERKVEEWRSGKQGRASLLKEIQQLVGNRCVDQALQLLRKLHSNGARLDDAAYSALFPFKFDDWQTEAVKHVQQMSVLVSAPGGAGKFVVAARCLYQAFVQGERCLIVSPYEALAKDRWQELQILFGSTNVGFVLSKEEDRRSDFPITVITLETLIKELREERFREGSSVGNSFSEGLRLAVMDRFHTLGDANFGSLWEEAVMLLDDKVKLVALSLPTKTSKDIVTWISCTHRPCELVVCESQPVQKFQYYCDTSGLHLLGNNDEKRLSSKSQDSLTVAGDFETDFQESIRVLLHSLQTEAFLSFAISFSSIEDCIAATNVANEVITEGPISAKEVARIEQRVQHFFSENANMELFVNKDDIKYLSRGFSVLHDGQLPLWTEFVQGLVRDNLVKIVFGTNKMLCSTRTSFRTVALCLISGKPETGRSLISSSDFTQLCGKAGRRGHDSTGNVVFVGGSHTLPTEGVVMDTALSIHSYFEPSYSLLLNLLSQHVLSKVRQLVDSNYGEYLVKKQVNEELKKLEGQILDVKQRKEDLEAQLFQKLQKSNTTKLQDATIFTHVDVRIATSEPHEIHDVLPGVLCAVLPGPSKLLYVILAVDNIFRLLPAGALDYVYTEEKPLDAVYESSTGQSLRAPPLPMKEKWKISPGDYLKYTSEGTAASARVVEALLHYGVKFRKTEDEPDCREEIRSCNGLLSTFCQQQEKMLTSRRPSVTTTWTKSEKLIEILEKAHAVELASKDTARATIKPLGVLISKLHNVENELWFATALSSSIVKPLTAPELAAICSALLYTSGDTYSNSSGHQLGSLNKANIAVDAPKRLRAALEKLETLRKKVEQLQGSGSPPVRLDGSVLAAVHSLCRESVGQDPVDALKYQTVLLVQKVIKLLHVIDNAWGRSLHVVSALEGTSGLHSLARRAAHLLQKAIAFER